MNAIGHGDSFIDLIVPKLSLYDCAHGGARLHDFLPGGQYYTDTERAAAHTYPKIVSSNGGPDLLSLFRTQRRDAAYLVQDQLRALIRALQSVRPKTVYGYTYPAASVVGIQDVGWWLAGFCALWINSKLREVYREMNVVEIALPFTMWPWHFDTTDDDIHPNESGVRVMAEITRRAIV